MGGKSKRNASEAFDANTAHSEQISKRHKKQKPTQQRMGSGDHDDAAAQLQRESQQSDITRPLDVNDELSLTAEQEKRKRRKQKRKDRAREGRISKSLPEPAASLKSQQGSGATIQTLSGARTEDREFAAKEKKKQNSEKRKRKSEAQVTTSDGAEDIVDADQPTALSDTAAPTTTSPLKSRKKEKRRKRKSDAAPRGESASGLEERVQRPEDVNPADIVEAPETPTNTSSEVGSNEPLAETVPLKDRIQAPPGPKRRRKSKATSKGTRVNEHGWSLSDGTSGSFLIQDPLMTDDDQYLILPTRSEIRIYSTSTSLLVRSIAIGRGTISTCTLSKLDPARLLVGTYDGTISLWDWTRGRFVNEWRSAAGLESITAMSSRGPDDAELVMVLHGGSESRLSVCALESDAKDANVLQSLLSRTRLNPGVQLFEEAGIIVLSTLSRLVLGSSTSFQIPNYTESNVTWREFSVPSSLTAVDSRVSDVKGKPSRKRLDVVIGLKDGSIVLYEDLLYKLIGKEKKVDNPINARHLNWHRAAVNTVKWSRDGNYVISGGSETVLVIWQLDTNTEQFLPHLSTDIIRISVSKRGSSYVLQLGDNSVMVLATADLTPTTNIALLAADHPLNGNLTAVADPVKQGQLLAAVPRATTTSDQASILQTYDTISDMQIARQALTRNLTTTVNIGPDGQQIKEPNVSHLTISYDGRWLMTVDQWRPPTQDLSGVLLNEDANKSSRGFETSLRFWVRNEDENAWELVNRVDQPHEYSKVLAIAQHPSRNMFASTCSDGIVHFWTPKARKRDGVAVRDQNGQQLYNWSVSRSIPCLKGDRKIRISAAALSFSQDGSVVAVSCATSATVQWTYLLQVDDVLLKTPSHWMTGLFPPDESSIATAFVDQYLLTLTSSSLDIFDLVYLKTIKSIVFSSDLSLKKKQTRHHLAANALDGTFAVGLNPFDTSLPGRVLVFDLRVELEPADGANEESAASSVLFDGLLSDQVASLVASPSSPGYIAVDSSAEIRQIRGRSARYRKSHVGAGDNGQAFRGLDAIFGKPAALQNDQSVLQGKPSTLVADEMEVDQPVSASAGNSLESVLGLQSSTQAPSVSDLFQRVVSLFRKPQPGSGTVSA